MNIDKPKIKELPKPKPYGKMTKREKSDLKRTIATQNKKIARLEKSGLASSSAAYRYLEAQLAAGANWLYRDKSGGIRFRGDISKMSARTLAEVKHETKQYRKAKTSTVKGTKRTRKAMVDSFNAQMQSKGSNIRVRSADQIKNFYEDQMYKSLQKMFYSEATKTLEIAKETHGERFLETIVQLAESGEETFDPERVQKMLEQRADFEQSIVGIHGIDKEDVQQLMIDYSIQDKYTPAEFRELLLNVEKHTEDTTEYMNNVQAALNDDWF